MIDVEKFEMWQDGTLEHFENLGLIDLYLDCIESNVLSLREASEEGKTNFSLFNHLVRLKKKMKSIISSIGSIQDQIEIPDT